MTRALWAAALAASLGISAASAQESTSPLSAIGRIFGQQPSAGAQQTAGQEEGQPTTDQVLRIERLETQIREMTGTIEQLQYRNQQLENQLRSMGATPAGALPQQSQAQPQPAPPAQALPQAPRPPAQAALPPAAAPSAPPPSSATGRRADVFDPMQNPNAPGAPRPLGGPQNEPPPIIAAEPPVGAPGGRAAGAPLDLSNLSSVPAQGEAGPAGALPPPPSRNLSATGAVASVAPPTDTPKDSYDLAYGYVLRKDYALAEDSFRAFLQKYPNDKRAADARYWLGESLFQRQQYEKAAQAFLDLSTKNGTHAKAPEALLRLAQSLGAMKQKEMACATLAEVGRKYPKASAGVKHGVEREQKRVHC
jgi:tol-pal system protein YbgF